MKHACAHLRTIRNVVTALAVAMLGLVVVAPPSTAANELCSDFGFTKYDGSSGSGAVKHDGTSVGSMSWGTQGEDGPKADKKIYVTFTLQAGYEAQFCIKASTEVHQSGWYQGPASTTWIKQNDHGSSHAGYKVVKKDAPSDAKDAYASVSADPATCETGERLVLGSATHASWGEPTRTVGPGSYSVTATANDGHLFGNGDKAKTFTGTLDGPKSAQHPDCVEDEEPAEDDKKVDYCHWDEGNGYGNKSNGAVSGLINGHMDHAKDVWPAFSHKGVDYPAQGDQSLLGKDCQVPDDEEPEDDKKVDYCHWDEGNGYGNKSNGAVSGLINGHMDHAKDIWPAFTYQGTHYEAQGDQSLLRNDCKERDDDEQEPEKDAAAKVVKKSYPTCESPSTVVFWMKHATAHPSSPATSPGMHEVTFTADDGHLFKNGKKSFTVSYKIHDALDRDDKKCQGLIPITPMVSVHDECGTLNDTGPDFVAENEYWTAVQDGDKVVFTAKKGWKFPAGDEVSHYGKKWTEYFTPNSDDPCVIEAPPVPDILDECGTGNAMWIEPEDTDAVMWDITDDGRAIATATAPETVFEGTESTMVDFGLPTETNTEECPIAIEVEPTVTMVDNCGTENDSGPTWAESEQYVGVDNGDGTVTFTANPPHHFVGEGGEPLESLEVAYTPNTDVPCPPELEGEEEEEPRPGPGPRDTSDDDPEVRGSQAAAAVPTSVDAGLGTLAESVPVGRNPLWLMLVGAGFGLLGFAGLRRRGAVSR